MAIKEAALDGDAAAFYRLSRGRLAQLARALARHARGHRFKSCTPSHNPKADRNLREPPDGLGDQGGRKFCACL